MIPRLFAHEQCPRRGHYGRGPVAAMTSSRHVTPHPRRRGGLSCHVARHRDTPRPPPRKSPQPVRPCSVRPCPTPLAQRAPALCTPPPRDLCVHVPHPPRGALHAGKSSRCFSKPAPPLTQASISGPATPHHARARVGMRGHERECEGVRGKARARTRGGRRGREREDEEGAR